MQLCKIQIGDGWHGPGRSILFTPRESIYDLLLELIQDECAAYGGKPSDWPLLTPFVAGTIVHCMNGWIEFSFVDIRE